MLISKLICRYLSRIDEAELACSLSTALTALSQKIQYNGWSLGASQHLIRIPFHIIHKEENAYKSQTLGPQKRRLGQAHKEDFSQ